MVRATDLEQEKEISKSVNNIVWVDKTTYDFLKKSSLLGGELLVAKRGEIGKIYLMPYVDFPATLGPNMYLARLANSVMNSAYAYYFFHTPFGQNQLKVRDKSTTIGALYKDDFKDILIFYPPLNEQEKIVDFIIEKTTDISTLIEKEEQRMALLKEYRAALISEVVTGKVKVVG